MERADRIFTLGNFRPCACAPFSSIILQLWRFTWLGICLEQWGVFLVLLYCVRIVIDDLLLPLCGKCFETFYQIDMINRIRTYGIPWELYSGLNGLYRKMSVNKYAYAVEWSEIVTIVLWNILILAVCVILQEKENRRECGSAGGSFFRIERVLHVVIDISVGLLVGNLLITFASGTYQLIAGAAGCVAGKYMFLSSVGNGICVCG